jgi:hypothetical protein
MRVSDLIEVPEIKTVIQLKDLEEPHLRRMILSSFVVTREVQESLERILSSFSQAEGRGAFLKGHFGSGKSHFLSMLSLLLRQPDSWEVLQDQAPSLESRRKALRLRRLLVVEISLIQHRSTEFLEDIFLRAIFRELSSHLPRPFEGTESRQGTFAFIRKTLGDIGFTGLVLLVDELSEFLRSKTDPHAFNEDIRFLQYLGEEASSFPLWVVASLQEWIEETGEINQDTFNKIKDRYPLRITLGRAHIEELVSHRLIRHREDADGPIHEIFQTLRRHFPSFPVEEARFTQLYPVHPATITLLDRLKPLFSEHRGIVDFIHYRLKGDGERGIPSFLDRPAQELLSPATIFDHFVHRIREMAEIQPFVEKVLPYYQDEIPQIFRDPDQQKVALDAVKLLILFAISPVRSPYTVRHMAEMILFRVTELEAEINYQYLRDILERLVKESSYLAVTPGKDPLEDQFAIDLRADIPGILRRKIRQGVAEIYPGDRRLFERLLPLAESPHLPFAGWAEQGQQRVAVVWEYTRRDGLVLLRQIDELSLAEVERMAEEWKRKEEDFFLVVGTAHAVERQYGHLRQTLLPRLREKCPGTFLFWVPAPVGGDEEEWEKEFLAALLLLERYREDPSERGQRSREFLQGFLNGGKKRLGEILSQAYFRGFLIWDDRQVEISAYGYLTQEKFFHEFIPPLLTRRFPKHHRIRPYLEAMSPTTISNLLRDFFPTGTVEIDERTKFGLRQILEGVLKPMGLVKKKGNQYSLQVDPRHNELAEHLLSLLEKGPQPPEELYWNFRKGDFGLLRHQFEVLVLALVFSGNILAYQGQRKKGLEDISRSGLQGITALGKGEILSEELRAAIPGHPLLSERFRQGPFTLPSQEELWNDLKSRKEQEVESLQNLLQRMRWAASFQSFRNLPWDSLNQKVKDVLAQWEEVKVSFPAREGLERFLAAAGRDPFLSENLLGIEELKAFFDHAERILFVYQYLSDPRLSIPDRPPYQGLREGRRALLECFEAGKISLSPGPVQDLLQHFQDFRERYIQVYVSEHRKARAEEQFAPYEKVRQSRRYQLLSRLNQLEMVSVQHNRSSVDRALTAVLMSQCNGPSPDALQSSPACSCGFRLGEEANFQPVREIEQSIDLGIRETVEALKSSTYQEKILPYLVGLEEVGETEKSAAVRRLLALPLSPEESFLFHLEEALSLQAVQGVNEAFRGRVVVVRRDLDQLYGALIHRKYSLAQVRKIFHQWLKEEEVSEGTFVQFVGQGEPGHAVPGNEGLPAFLDSVAPHFLPLLKETGQGPFQKALLVSLWAEACGLAPLAVLPLLPSLGKGQEERSLLLLKQLTDAARTLQGKNPGLFESLVDEVEREEGFPAAVWKLLAPRTALEIFHRETIFPSVLREAFERMLAAPEKAGRYSDSPSLESSPPPATAPGLSAKRKEMSRAWQAFGVLRQNLSLLKRKEGNPPRDFQRWESLYLQTLSPLSFVAATLPEQVRRFEVSLPAPAREHLIEAEKLLSSLSRDFSEFYRQALPALETGEGKRPKQVEDLPSLSPKRGMIPEGGARVYVLLDGMRWDLWVYIKENLFEPLANQLRILQEGVLWAHLPSSTPRQMECFDRAMESASGPGKRVKEEVWKIEGIDERIHTERGDLEHLFRNVLQCLQLDLAPRLQGLPARTPLLFFSDHGFIENPRFAKADKYRTSRYSHGESSPFEVIVPWALAIRI